MLKDHQDAHGRFWNRLIQGLHFLVRDPAEERRDYPHLKSAIIHQMVQSRDNFDITEDELKKLEKEYLELCIFQRHYSSSRWAATNFFIMLSFIIVGYSLAKEASIPIKSIGLSFGLIIYWFGCILYRRHKKMTYILREYIETLESFLGLYFHNYAKTEMISRLRTAQLLFYFGVFYSLFAIACIICFCANIGKCT